ncbi:hypothetical protein GW766_03210 [Candidatus Parcubacteria bacterium]|nr:hypothetical protein [Candidatus Parcubacteria bacterium]
MKRTLFLVVLLLSLFWIEPAFAAPFVPCSGTECSACHLVQMGNTIVKWLIGVLFVVFAIVAAMGGFGLVTSGGNPEAKSAAKQKLVNALIGILIVLAAWLLVDTIIRGLLEDGSGTINGKFWYEVECGTQAATFDAPGDTVTGSVPPEPPAPVPPGAIPCPAGVTASCKPCVNCTVVSGVPNKGCGGYTCYLDTSLLSKIKNISGVTGWRITESWPPTVSHLSTCHKDGTCADLNNSGGPTDPATIKKYYDAFKAAGLNVLYESKDCAPYIQAGVTNCATYSTMTNLSSFHVK